MREFCLFMGEVMLLFYALIIKTEHWLYEVSLGRNKRDNTIKTNSIVLVALRSVSMGEVVQQNKKEKADLIYVYNQSDIDELKNIPEVYGILNDTVKTEINDGIDFVNEETVDIEENIVIKDQETTSENKLDDVEFDWDDI